MRISEDSGEKQLVMEHNPELRVKDNVDCIQAQLDYLSFKVGLQALLNFGVVTSTIPNTGISLPFFSSGGTALLLQLFEMGIILAVARESRKKGSYALQ